VKINIDTSRTADINFACCACADRGYKKLISAIPTCF